MRLDYEVVHLVDGRLFDAESYQLTAVRLDLSGKKAGYYLLLRDSDGKEWRDDAAVRFVGPFASAEYAARVMCDLRLRAAASAGETSGSPGDAA